MTLKIVLLPDLIRETRAFPDAFFDLIREPIRQGCGVDIGAPPGVATSGGLGHGFDVTRFRQLALEGGGNWPTRYHQITVQARDYLLQHLHGSDLVLSFEMPPWLADLCTQQRIAFLDIRISPLRFGRDLYIALRGADPALSRRIAEHVVLAEELRMEAAVLSANVRMHQRRMREQRGYAFPELDGAMLFVGQVPYDASLLTTDGRSLRCEDFAEQLKQLCASRRLLYKPHPFAGEFAQQERTALERITGKAASVCLQNAYQVLSTQDDLELVGISSGLLQEAVWFDKKAHTLFEPFVALAPADATSTQDYQQIHFKSFLSPGFWHQILAPERAPPRLSELPALMHHHARETLDHWWDYSKVLTWERSFPYESFTRSGGGLVQQRVEQIEQALEGGAIGNQTSFRKGAQQEVELHKKLSIALYSRLASTYPSIDQALLENSAPAEYIDKVLDAAYYQSLHENNALFQRNNWLMPYASLLAERRFAHVREVGCGNGAFVAEIAKSVPRVIGLDWARSPDFPQGHNIEFCQQDLTSSSLEHVDLNCSADVLEHIQTRELPTLIRSLHDTARFNFHVIACYDDGHSHVSIFPPDVWLYLFRQQSPDYRILDLSIRHGNVSHVVCAITNL
ncbi:class I SAM-dependent methyltransferase [Xanthomonas sp. AM6]|uniref:class I SAM-dependent methyltransferase n=1 Tax=Xanthomonas sp. AM6 TaxID=2982531 RepID=UPI0021DAB30A|nr:class I SAM-dependent methyltransferase [Xanthomonas sp. AM6]UYB50495.1 class I SAM-dependent methyltransferase [Xanthomonas sp. AM6]